MTALLVVREDLDWFGFIIVLGIGAIAVGFAFWEDHEHRPSVRNLIDGALDPVTGTLTWAGPDVDHVDCANPECDQTICACRRPAECTGTTTLGCSHGEELCWDCRLGCTACAVEEQILQDLDWAAGR